MTLRFVIVSVDDFTLSARDGDPSALLEIAEAAQFMSRRLLCPRPVVHEPIRIPA